MNAVNKECIYVLVANGVYQNTVFGMAAKLPFKYIGAVILGTVSINSTK
jgi:equilibrative nucleoside transporter 1/2/3